MPLSFTDELAVVDWEELSALYRIARWEINRCPI
jgi:hypothetical protein